MASAVFLALEAAAATPRGSLLRSDSQGEFDRPMTAADVDGKVWQLGASRDTVAIVAVFLKIDCPICNRSLADLALLAKRYRPRRFEFYGIVSDRSVSRLEVRRHRDAFGIPFPILFDASGELLERLGPTHAPQSFVLSREGEVLYSGAIDDRFASIARRRSQVTKRYLGDALKAVDAGRLPGTRKTQPVGCPYEGEQPAGQQSPVTFNRDIAPLLHRHCAGCHHPGGAAPFSLERYNDAARRADFIAEVVASRLMPPWKPEHGYGRFAGDRSLSEREQQLFAEWAAGGAIEGDAADLPEVPRHRDDWPLGQPDLVLTMPESFDVLADGDDPYMHFVIPSALLGDRLVTAVDFRPGNARVVHHVNFYLDRSGAARLLDAAFPGPGYNLYGGQGFVPAGYLGGWTPGVTPQRLPEGMGRLVRKGSDFVLQIHYHPTGKPESDRSQAGIYFAPPGARQLVCEMFVGNMDLTIPQGESHSEHFASYVVPVDLTLLEITPHMHLLGKEIEVKAELPGGQIVPLVLIRDWDFRWQDHYAYDPPVRLPAGTRVSARFVYDNTDANPSNPHTPPRTVYFGEQSTEEMASVFFRVTADSVRDYELFVRHNQKYYDQKMNRHQLRRLLQLNPDWSPVARSDEKSPPGK